jgi:hypothetical protein
MMNEIVFMDELTTQQWAISHKILHSKRLMMSIMDENGRLWTHAMNFGEDSSKHSTQACFVLVRAALMATRARKAH